MDFKDKKILHIAPEWPLFRKLENEPGYVGGDIQKRRHSNATVDITKIAFPNDTFDIVICNHVLEHVPDDHLAMRETFRVMKPGGQGVFTVPISTEAKTWEPTPGMSVAEIERICGWDHKRYYGRDFSEKLAAAGYDVTTYEASEADRRTYSIAAETVFIARK
ncbi:MAG: class I SAM-dependent methyltransferase [Hyphomicrobiaceae bacterium]|nr:class I SAM-dependent methyltransferase [Hyphomicrobiaceae bacterium]